ncbi:ABC transporter [Wenjunlia vitaminophila]|uniref:ABC transporter n=1 Tax=Wenjunlia vitaminophila TaxID=76728 RepID=A0A0T6LSN0_WENVI|nr:ABC transporter permease [Wenjunlia vitaminophila]KRV48812.1 ABC transporter [Wenjunlia vitaminophila]
MFRTALRNVLAHKARLMMTVIAVLLGVSFVSGTLVFTDTVGDAYTNSSAQSFANTSVAVRAENATAVGDSDPGEAPEELTYLDQSLLDQLGELPGAASVTGSLSGFTAIAEKDGDLVGDGWTTRGGNYSGTRDSRYPLVEGRAPAAPNEIALDSETVDRTGYALGDTIRLSVDGPVLKQKLVGVFTTDDGQVAAGGSLALFDTPTAQKLFAEPGKYNEIILKAAPGTSEEKLKQQVEELLPKGTEAQTGTYLADEQADNIAEATKTLSTVLLAFAAVALFVGIFVIANTFSMLVAQRTRELALLRAVGATRRQVTRSVLAESFVVGSVAASAGFGLGILIAMGMRSLMGSNVPEGPLVVAPRTVLAAVLVGVLVTMLAAWLPARRASKIPPVAAMSSVDQAPTTRGLLVRNAIGAALTTLGVALVLLGAADASAPWVGVGAVVTLTGFIVLTPLLSRPAMALAEPVLRLFGVSGKLARQNTVRNPRRTAATAAALMIGLTLITTLTVVASSLQDSIDKMAADSIKADYTISMANFAPLSGDVAEMLADTPGVTEVSPMRLADTEVQGHHETITGVNPRTVSSLLNLEFTSGSLDRIDDGGLIVDDDTAEDRGWQVGDTVPLTYRSDQATERLTVRGIYRGSEMMDGIMLPTATLDPHLRDIRDPRIMVNTEAGVSQESRDLIEKALGDNPAVKVQTDAEVTDDINKMISMTLSIMYGLLGMAVVIAVLGVVNTLAMSVFERSREIGMLRAVGLDRRRVRQMVRLESVAISLFGAALGIGLGVFLAWGAGELITDKMASYGMVMPWTTLGIFTVLAATIGVLAALWPARRASRLNVLAAIKSD